MWKPKNLWVDGINVNASLSYDRQFSRRDKWMNTSPSAATDTQEEGIHEAIIVPSQYTSISTVEGIPISSFLSADLHKSISTDSWIHNISYGTSIRMSDNKGRGRLGSPETMDGAFTNGNGGSGQAFRPYNYADNILAEYQFSLYAEDNIVKNWDRSALSIDAGLRYDNQYGYSFLAPRINTSYAQDDFKIRGGFGLVNLVPKIAGL